MRPPGRGWLTTHATLTGKSPHVGSELICTAERAVPPITHLGKFIKKDNFQKATEVLSRGCRSVIMGKGSDGKRSEPQERKSHLGRVRKAKNEQQQIKASVPLMR